MNIFSQVPHSYLGPTARRAQINFENFQKKEGKTTQQGNDILMIVMKYLIDNVWYWRARLTIEEITIEDDVVNFDVVNDGRASTRNATLQYLNEETDEILWQSDNFTVNITSRISVSTNGFDYDNGVWRLAYQKRIINSAQWVNETVDESLVSIIKVEDDSFLLGYGLFNPLSMIMALSVVAILKPELSEVETSE